MKRLNSKRLITFSRLLFLIYLFFALYFLLFSEGFGRTIVREEYSYNLTLFKEIHRYMEWAKWSDTGYKMMLLNVLCNIICFVPFGFFMPLLHKKQRVWIVTVLTTALFSVFVESIQLIFKIGSFDVDDVLLNSIGGAIGYIVYKVVIVIYRKYCSEE